MKGGNMAVITIARQFGAGGQTLGRMISERLGYTLIDEEIVEMIALESNVSKEDVNMIAKETGTEGALTKLLHKLGPYRKGYVDVATEKQPGYIDGDLYISLLYKVIPEIAKHDNVIFLGRGSQYILENRPDTYHFLMIADIENRIDFIAKFYDLDRNKAETVINKQSKRRKNLYYYLNKTDFDEPGRYHMVFNMNKVKIEEAAQAVSQLVSGRTSP